MSKLWLIIKREYFTRVTKKTFILATLGTPLAIALFLAVEIYVLSYESESNRIAVVDDSGLVKGTTKALGDNKTVKFFLKNETFEELQKTYKEQNYDGILHLPAKLTTSKNKDLDIVYFSEDKLGIVSKDFIEKKIGTRLEEYRIEQSGYDRKVLDGFETQIALNQKTGNKEEDDKSFSAEIASFIGLLVGYIMFFVVLIYGSMVMRSVMEEKTNRIVEVIISSVKPFQLMLGKIIGVGMVGLTQLGIWAILIPAIVMLTSMVIGGNVDPDSMQDMGALGGGDIDPEETLHKITKIIEELSNLNWWAIIPICLAFFLGGYFLYSSIFAALGSAVGDDAAEAQSLTIPITGILMLGFLLMIAAVRNPNSGLAFWSSMIPFFSPILIPARLAFNPPWWEILLSFVLLVGAALFFVWLSARIYRVGILMYGKKATMKEIAKWMFYKD